MPCNFISKRVAKIILWIALILLIFSLVVIILFPTIYNSVLKKQISLGKGSIATNIWEDIPLPIYEKVYYFNITNKDEFLDGSEPLNVTEVGPYVYKSRWVKSNPFWNSNDTVSYRETRTYHFVPDKSCGTEEDEIYTLNGPLLIAASIAQQYGETARAMLSVILAIEGEKVVIQKKVKELTYEGYEDFIIKYATIIKPDIPFKNGIFSWLYGKNATDDGLFTIFTGVADPSKTGLINNWNGEERLSFWKGDTCNRLDATTIEIGPPIHGYQENYTFFQSIFCRSLTFNYTEDPVHFDIPTRRFKPTYSLLANSTENPENQCFEVGKERPSGILDVSPCQFGAPVFISFPHFYLADPSYQKPVTGLNPSEEKHGSHLDVEPITGLSVDIDIKFQINIEVTKVTGIFQTYKPSKGILPILWVDLSLNIDEDLADLLKTKTRTSKIIAYSVLGVLAVVSLILAIICFVVVCSPDPGDDDDPLLDAGQNYSQYYCTNTGVSGENHKENYEKGNKTDSEEKLNNSSQYTKNDLSAE